MDDCSVFKYAFPKPILDSIYAIMMERNFTKLTQKRRDSAKEIALSCVFASTNVLVTESVFSFVLKERDHKLNLSIQYQVISLRG